MPKSASQPHHHSRWRLMFFLLVLVILGVYAYTNDLFPNTWSWLPHHALWSQMGQHDQAPSLPTVSADEVVAAVQAERHNHDLPSAENNATLEKTARLVTLEIEDNQDINADLDYETILNAVSLTKPPEVESLTLFVSGYAQIDQTLADSQAQVLSQSEFTQIGVATRSAKLGDQSGVIVVILSSPAFRDGTPSPSSQTKTAVQTYPTFTGQDLWQAVQNYRRAHQLPLFEQSNELCTVASIRLNELLELGKLDNHDGFGPRADAFFEKNKGWTNINENLASGYETAVQTVEWGWDQSLGHQALIQSREYPKACAAANRGFAVLITGK